MEFVILGEGVPEPAVQIFGTPTGRPFNSTRAANRMKGALERKYPEAEFTVMTISNGVTEE